METDDIKALSRRIDSLQKSVDTMVNDRNISEDILARLGAVEMALHLNVENQMNMTKDIRADISEVKFTAEDVKNGIDDKTMVISTNNKGIFDKLNKIFKREVGQK